MTLTSLGWKNFNSLRDYNDEPTDKYRNKNLIWFVRQSMIRSRCTAFIQNYKSNLEDYIFRAMSEESNVKRNICEVIEANVKYRGKMKKSMRKNMILILMIIVKFMKKKERYVKKTQQTIHSYKFRGICFDS